MKAKRISGNIVDVFNTSIYPATLKIAYGKIVDIKRQNKTFKTYIMPGFIDSHIHIESSLLTPSEFGRIASIHGTVAVLCDPHEICNIMGIRGIKYMYENSKKSPVKIYFGAPPNVPASNFENSGAEITLSDIRYLFKNHLAFFLSEFMDYEGVIREVPETMAKIQIAHRYNKPVDGHAPSLRGKRLKKYIRAGISTDHESLTIKEAEEKIKLGIKIQIREGSAAKNFDDLFPLIRRYPDHCMFCTDDILPYDLIKGHINLLVKKAINSGIDIMKVLKCACINPVLHYGIDTGLLRINDSADFIEVDSLKKLNVLKTYINGEIVASHGKPLKPHIKIIPVNKFNVKLKKISDFVLKKQKSKINIINVMDRQIFTKKSTAKPKISDGFIVSDKERDILKITVVNRYKNSHPALGFVKNIGLKRGAFASSVAHDSHNIIAVGTSDEDICRAVNTVIKHRGCLCVVDRNVTETLPLPVAGIMSDKNGFEVAQKYKRLELLIRKFGTRLSTPFMTLSFTSLPVIPELKLTDKGLYDSKKGKIINLFK
jgi:adenine deaminase